jgi:hypothetical protein
VNGGMLLAEGAPNHMQRLPRFQRHQMSASCAAENPARFPWAIDTTFCERFILAGVASTC